MVHNGLKTQIVCTNCYSTELFFGYLKTGKRQTSKKITHEIADQVLSFEQICRKLTTIKILGGLFYVFFSLKCFQLAVSVNCNFKNVLFCYFKTP